MRRRRNRRATARSTRPSRPSSRRPASRVTLRKFEVRSVPMGEDAQGEAVVYVEHNGRSYRGSSVTTDIVESGVRAFLEVINRIESSRRRGADRERDVAAPPRPSEADDRSRNDCADPVREGLGTARGRARDGRHAGGPLRRPAPDPRGHLAAGLHGAARARPQGAAARPHARDDGPLDARRDTAQIFGGVPITLESAAQAGRASSK